MPTGAKLRIIMPIMNKLRASYLAGLIDGEGYISLHPNRTGDRTYYQPILKIGMTDRPLIEWLHKSYGGSFEHRKYANPKYNDSFCWTLNGVKLTPFLQHIQPFLRIKKRQADILLEKYRLQKKKDGGSYSDEEQKRIEGMYSEMRSLNKRGK